MSCTGLFKPFEDYIKSILLCNPNANSKGVELLIIFRYKSTFTKSSLQIVPFIFALWFKNTFNKHYIKWCWANSNTKSRAIIYVLIIYIKHFCFFSIFKPFKGV